MNHEWEKLKTKTLRHSGGFLFVFIQTLMVECVLYREVLYNNYPLYTINI